MSTIKSSGENLKLSSDNTKDIELQHNGSTKVTVKSDGNVEMGGQLQVSGGALSAPSFSFVGDTNTGISRPTTDAVNIVTGGAERMRIDSAGRVTMPYQPYAFVDFGGGAYVAYSGIVPFDNILANQGNHYNTSTYKFTCPVAGIYSVEVGVISQYATDTYHADVYHNGVSVTRNYCTYRNIQASSNIKCSANDTLWIQTDSINLYGGNGTSTYSRAIYTLLG